MRVIASSWLQNDYGCCVFVVDYLGIAADLKEALSFYSDAGCKGDPNLGVFAQPLKKV